MGDHQAPAMSTQFRTDDVLATKGTTFEDYGLKRDLQKGIYQLGFERPTPIQEESISEVLLGHDILARAKNGTGKTGAYLVPMLNRIDVDNPAVQALVLVPTRELSLQTSKTAKDLGKFLNIQVVCTTGGTSVRDDILRFKSTVHLVVGTPGRVLDLLDRGVIRSAEIEMVVLDEADKLLDRTFQRNITRIISYLPRQDKQLMLFSATFPQSVKDFTRRYMRQPKKINLMDTLTLKGVTQYYAFLEEKDKLRCLKTLFSKLQINQSIIFCNSVKRVEVLAKRITDMGSPCFYIHSSMDQDSRNKVFQQFRERKCRHLVCTDLFTRGIDVPTVNVVINFDFPNSSETYLHRIGRSGRGGRLGLAINLVTQANTEAFSRIERELNIHIDAVPEEIDKSLYVDSSVAE